MGLSCIQYSGHIFPDFAEVFAYRAVREPTGGVPQTTSKCVRFSRVSLMTAP